MGSVFARKTLLEAHNIVHTYGQGQRRTRALQGVDLVLKGGELTLLMGPSGSGKTTLLAILGCILTPSQGTVSIAGRAATGLSPEELATFRRTHIGYIFQSYNLFPTLSAEENVRVAIDVRGVSREEAMVAAQKALAKVGLQHKAKSFPAKLSGGEQQRVAVARALVGSPSVMLADEPTAALDSKNGMGVMELLRELAREPGRAVLAVTHDPRTMPFADRILHIEDGMIIEEQERVEGVDTVNDLSLARSKRMTVKNGDASMASLPIKNIERDRHLKIISKHLSQLLPDCEPPFTIYDVVKARFAQRGVSASARHCPAREDMLAIVAEWDNPDDALTSQSDVCLTHLAELFEGDSIPH
jgi:putative ABC transport system ATP-binding protein